MRADLEIPSILAASDLFPFFTLRASRIYSFSTSSKTIPWGGMKGLNRTVSSEVSLLSGQKREVFAENRIALLQENDTLDSISKFTDISEPRIGEDAFFGFFERSERNSF